MTRIFLGQDTVCLLFPASFVFCISCFQKILVSEASCVYTFWFVSLTLNTELLPCVYFLCCPPVWVFRSSELIHWTVKESKERFMQQHLTHVLCQCDNWLGCKCLTHTNKMGSQPLSLALEPHPANTLHTCVSGQYQTHVSYFNSCEAAGNCSQLESSRGEGLNDCVLTEQC